MMCAVKMLNQESVTWRNVHFVPFKSKNKITKCFLTSCFYWRYENVHACKKKKKLPALIGNDYINILQEIKPAGKKTFWFKVFLKAIFSSVFYVIHLIWNANKGAVLRIGHGISLTFSGRYCCTWLRFWFSALALRSPGHLWCPVTHELHYAKANHRNYTQLH